MLQGFKQFILRGNVVDLAVGVVIGVAFGNVVNAMVRDLVMPVIGAFGGIPNFSNFNFTINNSKFMIGDFINVFISFFVTATVIYFFVVIPMNRLNLMKTGKQPLEPATKKCPQCLSDIQGGAKRCAFCTTRL
jgi:large conductance mechanosensitive channel